MKNQIPIESMLPYLSPINPAILPFLTFILFVLGTFFTIWFFVYEVTSNKYIREIQKELSLAIVSSLFSGFSILCLMIWVGIYV